MSCESLIVGMQEKEHKKLGIGVETEKARSVITLTSVQDVKRLPIPNKPFGD
jgi:hypothetical protein